MINGFMNLYKPSLITSNKALCILKYHLKQNNIITKVGHLGTLDPLAEGVLPIALGRATRLFDYTLDKTKIYEASFDFGYITDTLDSTGITLETTKNIPTKEQILGIIPLLIGEIDQMPPKYSAKSINGVRAYKLARDGQEFELNPKKIQIYSIELLEQTTDTCFSFKIKCSGGTYVRAIARDMASKLDSLAVMNKLIRLASGIFSIDNATKLAVIEENCNFDDIIMPMDSILTKMESVVVDKSFEKKLLNGVPILLENLPQNDFKVFFDDKLIGIGNKDINNKLFIKTWLL
ncbi:MAG: tRNA pseudouridine(55) synthase TruB [Clostridia bacterium]